MQTKLKTGYWQGWASVTNRQIAPAINSPKAHEMKMCQQITQIVSERPKSALPLSVREANFWRFSAVFGALRQ